MSMQRRQAEPGEGVPWLLVYALLSRKTTHQSEAVLTAVGDAVQQYRINDCAPFEIMKDFEKEIINACERIFAVVPTSCCYFHLGKFLYRQVQAEGNDKNDSSIKEFVHTILAFACIPVVDLSDSFAILRGMNAPMSCCL